MKRMLCLTVLVLLALGFATQLGAYERIECTICHGLDTWTNYVHVGCPVGPPWPDWDEECESEDGLLPPRTTQCPYCSEEEVEPLYAWCNDCFISQFWP